MNIKPRKETQLQFDFMFYDFILKPMVKAIIAPFSLKDILLAQKMPLWGSDGD